MATPQQTPQQPIYPRDLNLALDRNFAKFTTYTDSRFESLAAQMRIANEESLIRDNDLANSMRALANDMRALADSILRLGERVGNMERTIQEGFAAQAERHNELMARVVKLEGNKEN